MQAFSNNNKFKPYQNKHLSFSPCNHNYGNILLILTKMLLFINLT